MYLPTNAIRTRSRCGHWLTAAQDYGLENVGVRVYRELSVELDVFNRKMRQSVSDLPFAVFTGAVEVDAQGASVQRAEHVAADDTDAVVHRRAVGSHR